jgi:non-specific protein-tyrosine kinase
LPEGLTVHFGRVGRKKEKLSVCVCVGLWPINKGDKMKLKKSIEKAKQQRQEAGRKSAEHGSPTEKTETTVTGTPEAPVTDKEVCRREWTSPVYSQSKSVTLDSEKLAQNRVISLFPGVPEAEYYKVLRTNIHQRMRENNWNTIMITSVQAGEGKTLTAINLAICFAKEYDRTVLLVDCDMKRQNVHQYLNFDSDKGIVDFLANGCPLTDLIIWPGIEKLTLISGGKTIANSAELLGSPGMKDFVRDIKCRYDDRYILFDTPPILGWADAIAFAPLVDCILMVVEEGRTSIKDVNKALDMIPTEKFLGFVLNRRKAPMNRYYY